MLGNASVGVGTRPAGGQISSLLVYRLVHAPVIIDYDRAKAGFDSQTERSIFFALAVVAHKADVFLY